MAYGIRETRRQLRAMNGDLVKLAPKREVRPGGRGYWLGQYRVELPEAEPFVVCEHTARTLSFEGQLQALINQMKEA